MAKRKLERSQPQSEARIEGLLDAVVKCISRPLPPALADFAWRAWVLRALLLMVLSPLAGMKAQAQLPTIIPIDTTSQYDVYRPKQEVENDVGLVLRVTPEVSNQVLAVGEEGVDVRAMGGETTNLEKPYSGTVTPVLSAERPERYLQTDTERSAEDQSSVGNNSRVKPGLNPMLKPTYQTWSETPPVETPQPVAVPQPEQAAVPQMRLNQRKN